MATKHFALKLDDTAPFGYVFLPRYVEDLTEEQLANYEVVEFDITTLDYQSFFLNVPHKVLKLKDKTDE